MASKVLKSNNKPQNRDAKSPPDKSLACREGCEDLQP